ncbi:MAG: LptF/LptG family permease [Elusimicrobia bacterium]|nr:LptF/LptG family permease [Elusimicrobiota bacterium]
MRIFTRYVGKAFLGPFVFGLGVFALLAFLGDLFDKMGRIATSKAAFAVVAQYMVLQLPYWAVRIVPMATLLATLFAVSSFVSTGEFTAVQAAGFEGRRFFRPLLWASAFVALAAFCAQETVLPACFSRSQTLWREKIHPVWEWDRYHDAVLVPGPERLVSATLFVVNAGTMERPVLDDFKDGRLARQMDAESGRWDPASGRWVFANGVSRVFDEQGGLLSEEPFGSLESDLRVAPRALAPTTKTAEEMSLRETLDEVARYRRNGRSARPLWTAFHQKIAYPFTNIVLCALGLPIALRLRRAPRAVSFAAALTLGFLYLWFLEMGWHLGKSGRLPPVVAAWSPNLVFAAVAAALHRAARI